MSEEVNDKLTDEEKKQLIEELLEPETLKTMAKQTFDYVDKDHSGLIDRNELGICLREIGKALKIDFLSDEQIDQEFMRLDTDNSGTIDLEEFTSLVKDCVSEIVKKME